MTGLAQFLLERIADDEAIAEQATRGRWTYVERGAPDFPGIGDIDSESDTVEQFCVAHDNDREAGYGACDSEDAAHIVRWQPSRVLADLDAKRQLVVLHGSQRRGIFWPHSCPTDEPVSVYGTAPCPTLRLLAAPYSGHPGFRSEWTV